MKKDDCKLCPMDKYQLFGICGIVGFMLRIIMIV